MSAAVEVTVEGTTTVLTLSPGPQVVEVTPNTGPQGPAGDSRVYIGPTPPANTSLIWVNTSLQGLVVAGTTVPTGRPMAFAMIFDDWDGATNSGGVPPSSAPNNVGFAYSLALADV